MESGLSCWKGYKRVPGTRPGSKGSCVKSSGPSLRKTTKGKGRNFLSVKEGAGMTAAGRKKYKAKNPGSTL